MLEINDATYYICLLQHDIHKPLLYTASAVGLEVCRKTKGMAVITHSLSSASFL